MNEKIKLLEFLKISREVTDNYKLAGHTWTDYNKAKCFEEFDEFMNPKDRENELEEFWDVFFSTLTRMHLSNYSDKEIAEAGIKCWNKIYQRSLITLDDFKKQAQQTFQGVGQ